MSKVNPFIILDFETGGLKGSLNAITEIAMLCVDGESLMEVGRYESYVTPYIGYEYDEKALTCTGLTLEKLLQQGKPLKQVGDEVISVMKEWYEKTTNNFRKKPILVGHNIKFDISFLQQLFKETKNDIGKYLEGDLDFFGHYLPTYLDTIHLGKLSWGNQKDFSSYTLTNCIQKANLDLIDSHKAMNDVIGTKELLIWYVNKLRSQEEILTKDKVRVRESFQFKY